MDSNPKTGDIVEFVENWISIYSGARGEVVNLGYVCISDGGPTVTVRFDDPALGTWNVLIRCLKVIPQDRKSMFEDPE